MFVTTRTALAARVLALGLLGCPSPPPAGKLRPSGNLKGLFVHGGLMH